MRSRTFVVFSLCAGLAACSPPVTATEDGSVGDVAADRPASGMDARVETGVDAGAEATVETDAGPRHEGGIPDGGSVSSWCDFGLEEPGIVGDSHFCVGRFTNLPAPRVLSFAPNGDLFVSSPSQVTPGGAVGSLGGIVVLWDDDGDGRSSESERSTFLSGPLPRNETMASVQGLVVRAGYVWFTTENAVWRVPYTPGLRRMPSGQVPEYMGGFGTVTLPRWTHAVAVSAGGRAYTSQGTYSASVCPDTPREGTVRSIDAPGTTTAVIAGLRNPLYMRCHATEEVCAIAELGDDGGASYGAREKIIVLRPGTNYGFPCCAGQGGASPFNRGQYDCARADREEAMFPLTNTPFGFDWAPSTWPSPYANGFFVALHGTFYEGNAYTAAGVVFAPTDPITHAPVSGWTRVLEGGGGPTRGGPVERPADVTFARDGRLFVADDLGAAIYWMAPRRSP